VDTETADRETDALDLAARFFAPAEAARLATLPEPARSLEFLRIWTLKEAFVKALGLGMSLPLNRFAFGAAPSEFNCAADLADPAGWSFRSLPIKSSQVGHCQAEASGQNREGWISVALRRPCLELDAAALAPAGLEWLAARHLPLQP
jgi:4'-phosphopantetheinyl transferase